MRKDERPVGEIENVELQHVAPELDRELERPQRVLRRKRRSAAVADAGPGGLSGAPLKQRSLAVLTRLHDRCGKRLTLIAAALKNAGSSIEHVYRTRIYLTHAGDWEAVARIHGKFFSIIRPAATMVVVAALLNSTWKVEIEADACIPD